MITKFLSLTFAIGLVLPAYAQDCMKIDSLFLKGAHSCRMFNLAQPLGQKCLQTCHNERGCHQRCLMSETLDCLKDHHKANCPDCIKHNCQCKSFCKG
jgi:hypothetical protein